MKFFNLAWIPLGMLIFSLSAFADRLESYGTRTAEHKQEVLNHIKEIVELLGVENPDLSPIENKSGQKGLARRIRSSGLIKRYMDAAIRKIVGQHKYGTPLTFHPSSTHTPDDAKEKFRQSRLKICREVMAKEVETKGLTIAAHGDADLERGPLDIVLDQLVKVLEERARNKKQSKVIVPFQHELLQYPSITQVLGSFIGAEIQEDLVYALHFQKYEERIHLTLSMLMTFLAEEDDAYLAVMDCLLDEVTTKLNKAREGIARHKEITEGWSGWWVSAEEKVELKEINVEAQEALVAKYLPLETYLSSRYKTATALNEKLKALAPEARADLFVLLIRAQQSQIPSGDEVSVLLRVTGQQINEAIKTGDTVRLDRIRADINFFQKIQGQLDRLKYSLYEQRDIDQQTEEIIEQEIRKGRR